MNVRDYLHRIAEKNKLTNSGEEAMEGKRKTVDDKEVEQNKNKDLTMHMYKVLSAKTKGEGFIHIHVSGFTGLPTTSMCFFLHHV